MTTRSPDRASTAWWRPLVCVGLGVIGAGVATGCLLAIRLELDGFGRPRDTDPRTGYLFGMGALIVAGVAVPGAAARLLLPGRWWLLPLLVIVITGVAAVLLLGLR